MHLHSSPELYDLVLSFVVVLQKKHICLDAGILYRVEAVSKLNIVHDKAVVRPFLTILTWKNCVVLTSVQAFIEIEVWLLLTFSICLSNQLISIHSIVTCQIIEIFVKRVHQKDRK